MWLFFCRVQGFGASGLDGYYSYYGLGFRVVTIGFYNRVPL